MKKTFFVVSAVLLVFVTLFGAVSVSPVKQPEILTVKADENGDYGYIDYSFVDEDGNILPLFGNKSYEPASLPKAMTYSRYSAAEVSPIPAAYDSREHNFITSPKQQGQSGNCWAFSAMSMLESDAIVQGIDDIGTADYSEAHFSWFTSRSLTPDTNDPTYGDGCNYDDPFMMGGNWIISAGSLARWSGAAEDADYPFNYSDLSAMGNYDEADRYDTGSGIIIKSAEELIDINDAKKWIMEHGSATLAYYFDLKYYNNLTHAYYYNGTNTLNHQITIIGWDDNYSVSNFNTAYRPSGSGAWLCKNSWGNWGDEGYFWISYYDTSIDQLAGISARAADSVYRNYTYNGAGWESYLAHSGSAALANVFTAKGPELLSSVSTYTMSPGQKIRLRIYKNLSSAYTDPVSGNLVYEYTTILKRAGYHTIDLEEKIELKKGTVFSVVVEYSSDGTVYLPVEANGRGSNNYSCKSCQSYAYLPQYNIGWYDVVLYGFENCFIQAFTECDHNIVTDYHEPTCSEAGYKINNCDLCGKMLSEEEISAFGHNFSEWSEYKHDFETDTEVSTRECLNCGYTETSTIVYVKNTVKLEDFIDFLFERIIEFLRQIFGLD